MNQNQIKIKICGLKRMEDIRIINKYNPDYIGFVFAESKRQIDFEQAAKLKKELNNDMLAVGVFVDHDIEDILYLIENDIIDMVQLHGNENKESVDIIKSFDNNIEVIKSIEIKNNNINNTSNTSNTNNINNINNIKNNNTNNNINNFGNNNIGIIENNRNNINNKDNKDNLVDKLDYWEKSAVDYILLDSGKGTGETFNWQVIEEIKKPFFLAGGINSQNIREAYNINPFAFDLSSGAEENGVKSSKKIAKIMDEMNNLNGVQ
jgi:phosphoribosylanthranilate isomerase